MVTIALALISVGAFSEPALPQGFSSQRQLLGINLLLILMPAYMTLAWGASLRRSARLLAQVDGLLGSPPLSGAPGAPARWLSIGAMVGILYAIFFNLPIATLAELFAGGPLLVVLVVLMILVWVSVGIVLTSRLYVARRFHVAGTRVPLDPYDLSPLEPFARSGMGDVALVIGALVLATVQSIDATFRYQNYLFSTIVAVPAATLLLLMPMYAVHARLKQANKCELRDVNAMIRETPKSLTMEDIASLELLLKRRERIQGLHTWPLNVSMISRLVIYGVIPPVAWIGAALMEWLIGRLLGN